MTAVAEQMAPAATPPFAERLSALVYEILDGRPLYRQGYRAVLSGESKPEDVMGSSGLQSMLVSFVFGVAVELLDRKKYRVATGEVGGHLDHRNNVAYDVAVFERSVLTPDKITTRYIDVPAKVVVEIDVRIDPSKPEDFNYVNRKTRKLLEFGTEKVIWIFTDTQQVLVAARGADAWLTVDWHRDLELLDGQFFNVGRYLEEEGVRVGKEGE